LDVEHFWIIGRSTGRPEHMQKPCCLARALRAGAKYKNQAKFRNNELIVLPGFA
jgi:hypothetical protein